MKIRPVVLCEVSKKQTDRQTDRQTISGYCIVLYCIEIFKVA